MKALDRFVRRYRRNSTRKALGVGDSVFLIEVEEVLPALAEGRL